jgi:menaquinone-dependent protoporphyrinogen IX oxidase
MRSLIVYYSHSGNTALVANKMFYALSKKGEADIVRLEYAKGSRNLLVRLLYRMMPALTALAPVVANLKDYDVICLGIPVIAGRPSSAITKYVNMCENISNKKVICCYVYGVEISAKQCAKYIENIFNKKGQPNITQLFIPWNKVHNEQFLDGVISTALTSFS